MDNDREEAIATRAYRIWEQEGSPDGQDVDHWHRAERELADESDAGQAGQASPEPAEGADDVSPAKPGSPAG